ncbi:Ferredoxin subunit of nitrite reductase or a ring-hydroxylating dioxygenase [Flavobacterium glycines]|uniref:Ferredoxin subunit of nitrite reductase or a ring-hydroxylating dioxygenase n=1 Tax=Flavobacterium glycines TaxID=551990 RepID=A0A1B9DS66_9FLAO|nr:hypothetical protein [Flavobacterium glycines]OCB72515.1 hypothetical protein FBGL_07695 [Flavobacterium glycines]GEL10008.1 hypothetical protein FGL01_07470 [Flavobacterium glycines]SDI85106.1 Ferredoxin subunit of nitrite reductase or a ring-hydroxylating dioxygenase [Flavobacterium glycines]
MKKIISLSLLCLLFFSCSDNGFKNNNPYIPNYNFSITFDLNYPAYSKLNYASNAVYYAGPEVGPKGIYVFYTGSGYNAFDAACPNQALSSCSTLTLNGINLVCPCDKEEYSLFTGQGKLQYPLKQYRVEKIGNILRVYN